MFKKTNKLSKKEEEKVNETFESFKKKKYSEQEINKVLKNEDKIKAKMNDESLKAFIEDVKIFFLMLKDFFTGNYKEIPVGTIIAIAGSLLYVLSPFDIIPDFLAGIGYVDDAGVITLCLNGVREDVEKYKIAKGL